VITLKNKSIVLLVFFCLVLITFTVQAGKIKVNIDDGETQKIYNGEQGRIDIEEYADTKDMNFEFNLGSFKGNGGPMIGFLNLNFKELNNELDAAGFKPFSEQIVLIGGGGLGGFTEGSRFGGYGLEGSSTTINNNGQKASYSINYGGFLYEHGIYADQNMDVAIGSLFGGGTQKIDLIYGEVNDFPGTPQRNIYESSFIALEPRINLHYQFATFMGIDFSAGYLYTYNQTGSWKADNKAVDVPMDNISSPVFSFKFGFGF